MKKGDLVWFGITVDTHNNKVVDWGLGLLLDYCTIQKIAIILYEGKIKRVRGTYATKAGKKPKKNWEKLRG
jgi:hypothetical protein